MCPILRFYNIQLPEVEKLMPVINNANNIYLNYRNRLIVIRNYNMTRARDTRDEDDNFCVVVVYFAV